MKGLSKGRYDETFAGEDGRGSAISNAKEEKSGLIYNLVKR